MSEARRPSDILRAARELISTPERWTQGISARDERGHPVNVLSGEAFCFCSSGAIERICSGDRKLANATTQFLANAMGGRRAKANHPLFSVITFNDRSDRRHVAILDKFDKAITLAEQSEAGS